MEGSIGRFTLALVLLPFFFLAMAGLSQAATIHVNTLTSEPGFPLLCSLPDAIASAEGVPNACTPGTGDDAIVFDVTGTILVDKPLVVTRAIELVIEGPQLD